MIRFKAQSAGGKAKAAKIRAEYARNPNICLHCNESILPKHGEKLAFVKARKFCSHRCSAGYHHKIGAYKKRPRKVRKCSSCDKETQYDWLQSTSRKFCRACWKAKLIIFENKSKGDVPRRSIAAHARAVCQEREKQCAICGYRHHVEVCHKRAVKDFPETATIAEINSSDNLILLCPNHHWEFDRGRLSL